MDGLQKKANLEQCELKVEVAAVVATVAVVVITVVYSPHKIVMTQANHLTL